MLAWPELDTDWTAALAPTLMMTEAGEAETTDW